jgi:hypothetical protein
MDEDWVDDGITLWMGCDGSGEFALRPGWWQALLGLARQHGWDPAGTQPPWAASGWTGAGDPPAWDGRYWPGLGQQVTGADARHLGAALARAVADIPDSGGRPYWRPDPDARPVTDVTALELLAGAESKEVLGWFLEHCAGCCGGGGFAITDDDYDYLADDHDGGDDDDDLALPPVPRRRARARR